MIAGLMGLLLMALGLGAVLASDPVADTAAQQALSPPPAAAEAHRPRNYVYNLTESEFRNNHEAWKWVHNGLYGLEVRRGV